MSEAPKRDMAEPEAPAPAKPTPESQAGLFERLRALFGLGPASVRDDIEDALEEAGPDADFTPLRAVADAFLVGRLHSAEPYVE